MIRNTKLQLTTTACLLAILCYGLPFHDNALDGLCKIQNQLVMAKSQNGGKQPPKKQTPTSDSTAYYKKEIQGYRDLIKSEPKTPIGQSNIRVYQEKISKLNDALNRQSLKGKPGYDKNGNPLKKK